MEISLAGLLSGLYHNFDQLTVSIRHASTLKKMFYYHFNANTDYFWKNFKNYAKV